MTLKPWLWSIYFSSVRSTDSRRGYVVREPVVHVLESLVPPLLRKQVNRKCCKIHLQKPQHLRFVPEGLMQRDFVVGMLYHYISTTVAMLSMIGRDRT